VNSWFDDYSLSDFNLQDRFLFGGSPWKNGYAIAYAEQSPITYVSAITTSTVILHDTGDAGVPIANAYALYHALKGNGTL